jgi:3'(2'), 5'-bisphosphate nucleotidase
MTGGNEHEASDLASLLDSVRRACVRAGDAILEIARTGAWHSSSKADDSPLTHADLAANTILVDALHALTPGMLVVSEETACEVPRPPERFWLVDPLDGTREFVAGNGEYTVNVALVERGVPVLGVVHAPARQVTYAGARGHGATRTDRNGEHAIAARASGHLTVLASRSHRRPELASFLAALPAHDVTGVGSSLKFCLVADGTAQLYPRLGPTYGWDTAAAHAVVLEAGGYVVTLGGEPLRYDPRDLRNPPFVCSSLPREIWESAARAVR